MRIDPACPGRGYRRMLLGSLVMFINLGYNFTGVIVYR